MNIGCSTVSRRLWIVLLFVLVGGGVASSIPSCVLINDAIPFLDACFALFRLLPMTCLFMVLVLAGLSLAVSGACGPVFILEDRRVFVVVRAETGLALVLTLSIILGCLGLCRGLALLLRM